MPWASPPNVRHFVNGTRFKQKDDCILDKPIMKGPQSPTTWCAVAVVPPITAAWLVGSGKMTITDGIITSVIAGLILLVFGKVAKYLPRIIATADRKRGIVALIGVGCVLTLALSYGINAYLHLPVNLQATKPSEVPTATPSLPPTKPHIRMISSIGMLESTPAVAVVFHNRAPDDLDKLTLKIILHIDGKQFYSEPREVPVLRFDTKRQLTVMITHEIYDAVMAGKLDLKVLASAAYSFHGAPFTESCVSRLNARVHLFDYIGC